MQLSKLNKKSYKLSQSERRVFEFCLENYVLLD